MRNLFLAVLLGLSACAGNTPAQNLKLACAIDGAVVPIADPVLAAAVPSTAPAVTVDVLLVHPAVVALCAAKGGVPVAAAAKAAAAAVVAHTAPPVVH